MAATLVSIFCTAWIAWSIHELHDFAFRQAKAVNDSIEISRYAILAANRRAEATEKTYDLAAEASRSQLRAYVSVLGISTQNAFEKNMTSSLNYKNVGQTPALGLRILTDAVIISSSGSDVKPPRTYSTSYSGDNEPTIALGGDIAASDPVNRTFKEAELEEFREKITTPDFADILETTNSAAGPLARRVTTATDILRYMIPATQIIASQLLRQWDDGYPVQSCRMGADNGINATNEPDGSTATGICLVRQMAAG
jgi:hypothetical protein